MRPIKVGLLGLGTVGAATFDVFKRNYEEIIRRAGRPIEITSALVRDVDKHNEYAELIKLTTNASDILEDPEIDIIVELMGGADVPKTYILQAIESGKHIVTANKALIAEHGNEIFTKACHAGINVAFEAAVAGGIPIIKALREGLAANRINCVTGIVNGTCNYILSQMKETKVDFTEALKQAQELGYAEADPTFDIEGVDAGHKLAILAAIAYGIPLQFDNVYIEGISNITAEDIEYAESFGYAIKHLAIAKYTEHRKIELRVHPALVPKHEILAQVNGAMNAVWVNGDALGPTLYYGQGAGGEPTASAVIADLVEVVRTLTVDPNNRVPHLAFQADELLDTPIADTGEFDNAYYLRLNAQDRPGTLADITSVLGQSNISIQAILQKDISHEQDAHVPVVILTQPTLEKNMNHAIAALQALPSIDDNITRIRKEVY